MKKKTYFLSIKRAFDDYVKTPSMISLGNSFELPGLFRSIGWRILSASMPGKVKFANRLVQLHNFGKYILIMRKHHGATFTVGYLKACQLAVQKRIGEDRIKSLRDLNPDLPFPRLTTSGLPRFIPLRDRRAILNGSESVIRWWLTIFSVYRVISIPGKLKLDTITAPFSGSLDFMGKVSSELRVITLSQKESVLKNFKPGKGILFLETSSPSFAVSWVGMIKDLLFLRSHNLILPLESLLTHLGSSQFINFYKLVSELVTKWEDKVLLYGLPSKKGPNVGQLSCKEEAAGKVRVFAMVDVWTQSVLKPLHDTLFSYLKSLPNDGTFDQFASVKRAMKKAEVSNCSFGYDLSAATDRLPLVIQKVILEELFSKEFSDNWSKLLVDRDYVLDSKDYGSASLRYEVGQPMGAYSSWAMLAVTHHYLVQLASRWSGQSRPGHWYDNYELLGDDIIIFNEDVATQYLSIMEGLGVPINLSKSVVAKNSVIEFAKVTGYKSKNVSAISWKMFMSQNSMMGRVNIVYSLLNKDMTLPKVSIWLRNMLKKSKFTQGEINFSLLGLLSMYSNSGKLPFVELIKATYNQEAPSRKSYKNILENVRLPYIENMVAKLAKKQEMRFSTQNLFHKFWMMDESWFKRSISATVTAFLKKVENGWRDKTARTMASDMFGIMFPNLPEKVSVSLYMGSDDFMEQLNFIAKALVDRIKLDMNPTLCDVIMSTDHKPSLPSHLLSPFGTEREKLKIWMAQKPFKRLTIDELLVLDSNVLRLTALSQLAKRASDKIEGIDPSKVTTGESPLSAIKFILKANKRRPKRSYYVLRSAAN